MFQCSLEQRYYSTLFSIVSIYLLFIWRIIHTLSTYKIAVIPRFSILSRTAVTHTELNYGAEIV